MTEPTATAHAEQAAARHREWARTHCYLCGVEFTDHTIELLTKLDTDGLTAVEEKELETADCPNGCWAKEAAAQAELDRTHPAR